MTWWKLAPVLAAVGTVGLLGVGTAVSGDQTAATVNVRIAEWDVVPQAAPKTSASKVTFVVRNTGKLLHEFVVLRTAKPAGLLAARNAPEAPEAGAVGEIGDLKPGATKTLRLDLKAGHYALICNLPGHYSQGQFADFYVR